MRNLIFIFLLGSLCLGQTTLDTNPRLIGITLGDSYSKWSNTLVIDGTKKGLTKYFYKDAKSQTIFGYPIETIEMIFDSNNILKGMIIKTQRFKEPGWRPDEFTDIKEKLSSLFGKPVGWSESGPDKGDITWRWQGQKNMLLSSYNHDDSFKGSFVKIYFMETSTWYSSEDIPHN